MRLQPFALYTPSTTCACQFTLEMLCCPMYKQLGPGKNESKRIRKDKAAWHKAMQLMSIALHPDPGCTSCWSTQTPLTSRLSQSIQTSLLESCMRMMTHMGQTICADEHSLADQTTSHQSWGFCHLFCAMQCSQHVYKQDGGSLCVLPSGLCDAQQPQLI